MASTYELLHLLLLLSFTTCSFSSISTTTSITPTPSTAKAQRLVSKLIHRRSIHHPLYNPNETGEDRIEREINHTIARFAYLQKKIEGSLVSNDHQAALSPTSTGPYLLANISIGQPPIPQLLIMDTASNLLWVMCIPCSNCVSHPGPLFDPSKSSTYYPVCNSPFCGTNGCNCTDPMDQAPFSINYAEHTSASGNLAYEQFVFETSDEGFSVIHGIEFGCAHDLRFNYKPEYNGLLGLENERLSLATQMGGKFSYCIGSLTDRNYNYNQLILGGGGADLEGYQTPFEVFGDMYYVTMEGVSFGEKRLEIPSESFEREKNGTGGVIIDTGSPLTYLFDDVFRLLEKEVKNLLEGSFRSVEAKNVPWLLCYLGTVAKDLEGFPVVTFHFAEGADLVLDTWSLFEQTMPDTFCMAVGPASEVSVKVKPSVIGLLAQQSYNVGYDLANHYIYFQRIDCSLITG